MLLHGLVVLSAQLRPTGELVLRANGVHLALEAYHFAAQADLLLHVLGGLKGEARVDMP
jgi:hypothetical protein